MIRWGGDEFLVVLPGLPAHELDARSSDVARAIEETGQHASIGSALFGPGINILTAIEAADRAMYSEKKRRKIVTA